MFKKKIEVVEINKKEDKITLEEKQSPLLVFWLRHRFLIFITALIISLSVLGVSLIVTLRNVNFSREPIIKEAKIDSTLSEYNASVLAGASRQNEASFIGNGEILLIKTIDNNEFTLKYYSDGMSLKINKLSGEITRIAPMDDGSYGVNDEGIIDYNTLTSRITIKETKEYAWGTVTYYSDGSAILNNSKVDIYIRNGSDVTDTYISDNRVAYLKETKNIGNNTLNYYYDGTIELIIDNVSYLVRSENDINIDNNNNITFTNHNEAKIYNTISLDDGNTVYYYEDGGAIIKTSDGNTLSVRKSNSIIINTNKIYEIIDNIYVSVSKEMNNIKYYTNGGAVVNYNNTEYYVDENSNIKLNPNNNITSIGDNAEILVNETNISGENVKSFTNTAVVTTNEYIAIVPKDNIMYDSNGKVIDLNYHNKDEKNSFTVTNTSNEVLRYRVVLEESSRTDVDTEYLRYMLTTSHENIGPNRLDNNIWELDNVAKSLNIKGKNYILYDGSIEPLQTEDISLILWASYDDIPNSQMDKYFYGTIKLYAWTEIER